MNVIYYHESITGKGIADLIESIQKDQETTVYFTTIGGNWYAAQTFVDFTRIYKGKLTLIGCGQVSSSGFYIFFKSKAVKKILPFTKAIIHHCNRDINTLDTLDPKAWQYKEWKLMDQENYDYIAMLGKKGLSKANMKLLNTGYDVMLRDVEIRKLIRTQRNEA